jgi:AcrR family transcriptional regulator
VTPATDDEARGRILSAARARIDASGRDFSIADVARDVGVTRQTVYRYYATTEALLVAAAIAEVNPFLDRLAAHLESIHDPAEAVVEAIAHTLERLPNEKYANLLLGSGRTSSTASAAVTSDVALSFGRVMLDRYDVDWAAAGITGDRLDELAEFTLRILQSLLIDPGRPPRTGTELRGFLGRWVAPAVAAPRQT